MKLSLLCALLIALGTIVPGLAASSLYICGKYEWLSGHSNSLSVPLRLGLEAGAILLMAMMVLICDRLLKGMTQNGESNGAEPH